MKALVLGLRIMEGLMALLMLGLFLACLVVSTTRNMVREYRVSRFSSELEEWERERRP